MANTLRENVLLAAPPKRMKSGVVSAINILPFLVLNAVKK